MKIQTKRCTITHLCANDIPILSQLNTDPKVRAFLGGPVSKEIATKRLTDGLTSRETAYYVPRLNTDQNMVGLIMLSSIKETKNFELAYLFFPKYWGKGYAQETISALITSVFNTQNISTIIAETQSANAKSIQLLHAVEMKHIETLIRFGVQQSIFEIDNPNHETPSRH